METTMDRFVASVEIKARNPGNRTFVGSLSTSHLDVGNGMYRDIVWPGAFRETLAAFSKGADPNGVEPYVPLLDSHSPWSIFNVLGHMLSGEEVLTNKTLKYQLKDGGTLKVPEMFLNVEWQIIDGIDGDRTLDRLRPGSVRKMSMGYESNTWDIVELSAGTARNLRKVTLGEGSLVVFAMNPRAEVDIATVKTMLAGMRGASLTEVERKELRRLASRIGSLLRNAPPAEKAADAHDGQEPDPPDPPPDEADAAKASGADEETKALLERIQTIIGRKQS